MYFIYFIYLVYIYIYKIKQSSKARFSLDQVMTLSFCTWKDKIKTKAEDH